jgi:hypothetical protein
VLTFRLTVTDNAGATGTDTVNVTVQTGTSNNLPPVASNSCISTPAGTGIGNGVLTAVDPEGQTLTYELLTNGRKGLANVFPDGRFTYTPNTNLPSGDGKARGMDQFTFRVTDTIGLSATGTVTVLIDGKVRIMPLGDSITAGITSNNSPPSSTRVGYRLDLFNGLTTLSAGKYGIDFVGSQSDGAGSGLSDTNHEGHPGWCDDNNPYCTVASGQAIAPSVVGFLNANPADIVLLHIGTNEFSTSNVGVDTILANVSSWAGSNYPVSVFVARIIPTSTGILDVQSFNDDVVAIATDRPNAKVFTVDQQSALHKTGDANLNLADPALMGDTYHPNSAGYTKMADRWKSGLVAAGVLPNCP